MLTVMEQDIQHLAATPSSGWRNSRAEHRRATSPTAHGRYVARALALATTPEATLGARLEARLEATPGQGLMQPPLPLLPY